MDRDGNRNLLISNSTRRPAVFVNRVFTYTTREIFGRLRKKATSVSRSDRALLLSRTWPNFCGSYALNTWIWTRSRTRAGRAARHDATRHDRARTHSPGPGSSKCVTRPTYDAPRVARPNPVYPANIENGNVSLFSDWFCERHARASLTLTPDTARAGKVRSYSSQRRSPGRTPVTHLWLDLGLASVHPVRRLGDSLSWRTDL